jgi:hypothetical protein
MTNWYFWHDEDVVLPLPAVCVMTTPPFLFGVLNVHAAAPGASARIGLRVALSVRPRFVARSGHAHHPVVGHALGRGDLDVFVVRWS